MGLFEKVLSTIGIGGPKVDTILDDHTVGVGEILSGMICITGGKTEQIIHQIIVEVNAEYIQEIDDSRVRRTANLESVAVAHDIEIYPGEEKQIRFEIRLPEYTPVSMHKRNVWIETVLDTPAILDASDRDYIQVVPNYAMDVVLTAITDELGFRLRELECEASRGYGATCGFVQEFEFVPQRAFRGRLDELEVIFVPHRYGVELCMQVDRRVRGLKSLFEESVGLDESRTRVVISQDDAEQGSEYVAKLISEHIERYSH